MRVLLGALLMASIACACITGGSTRPASPTPDPTASPPSSASPVTGTAPVVSAGSPTVVLGPSAGGTEPWSCPVVTSEPLEVVVALAVDGLADTTGQDGWSRACAGLQPPDLTQGPYTVTVEIAWEGTLHAYGSIQGALRIEGLADEAVAFDAGHRIALRSGELVAVVSDSRSAGGSPSFTEASARQVAEVIRMLEP